MRIICVANQKGGVGKTTTAVNLAFGLAKAGHPTLLIDLDPQANATTTVLGRTEPSTTIYDVLLGNKSLSSVVVETKDQRLSLVPSDIDLAGAEAELIGQVGGQTLLRSKFRSGLDRAYEYVIVDTPPSLGLLTLNALAASGEVLIPVSASFFGLKGIAQLEATIEKVRGRLDARNLKIVGVVCTIYDRTNVARDVHAVIKKRFGERAFATLIPKNIKLEEAHSRGQSVFDYAPRSQGARAYEKFVEEVIGRG